MEVSAGSGGKRAPGWIISCSSMPDGHVAVTWRGNGKWHHYHSNTGTTFGVRAGIQRICHTTSHLPTGKTITLTGLATHSMDNYFIWNGIILVIFVIISHGVVEIDSECLCWLWFWHFRKYRLIWKNKKQRRQNDPFYASCVCNERRTPWRRRI